MQISSSISTTHQLAGTREGYNYRQATDQSWSDQSVSGLSDFGSTRKQAWDQLEKAMIFFPHESTSNMKCADQQQSSSDYRKSSLLQAKDMVNLHNYEDLAAASGACHPALNLSQTGGYNWVNTEGDTFKNVGLLQEGMSHRALINYQLQEGNYSPPALNKYQAYSPTNYNHKGAGGSSANSAVFTAGNAALATVHGTDRIRTLHESEKGQLMHMSGRARIGLNLGGRTYFAADDYAERLGVVGDDFGFGKVGPSKPSLRPGPLCRVDACQTDLSTAKRYHRRHKVCDSHSKAATVLISKQAQRFCQQCSRFHTLSEFDDGKRSCRKRLANHNKRRRKPPPISTLSKSIPTTLIDHKNSNELCKEMKVAS